MKTPHKASKTKSPRYPTWFDHSLTLSDVIAIGKETEYVQLKPKVKKVKKKAFVSCLDCPKWKTIEIVEDKIIGKCTVDKCINL